MDDKLKERLLKIAKQIQRLYEAEGAFLTLDAAKDHQLAVIIRKAPPELSSEAAKLTWARSKQEFLTFREALATAEANFHKEKHKLELSMKAYDAAHLSYKIENSAIVRGVE